MSKRQYMGERVRVTWARRAGRITLRRDVRGLWTLTLPDGVPEAVGALYLAGCVNEPSSAYAAHFAPAERHLALGRRVTLGRDGVPSGEMFIAWRRARLDALLGELSAKWQVRLQCGPVRVETARLPGFWGKCRFDEGLILLNEDCALLPPDAVEELLLHELCHLQWHDHCAPFWRQLTEMMPDWAQREGMLRTMDLSAWPEVE